MKRFLGVCALTPSHALQRALPDSAAARSTYLSVKKRGGEACEVQCCTREGVSKVPGSLLVQKL